MRWRWKCMRRCPTISPSLSLIGIRECPTKTWASGATCSWTPPGPWPSARSEEHTSELQSLRHLVCRLLLEKKKTYIANTACEAAAQQASTSHAPLTHG